MSSPIKIAALKKIVRALEECDAEQADILSNSKRSEGMTDALVGAVIERRATLLEQLRRHGINISVEV